MTQHSRKLRELQADAEAAQSKASALADERRKANRELNELEARKAENEDRGFSLTASDQVRLDELRESLPDLEQRYANARSEFANASELLDRCRRYMGEK